jgi:outer membrane protein assembly factor BamB
VASPAVFNSTVYLGSDSGHVYALDKRTGSLKWTFEQKCMPANTLKCGGNGIRSSPAVFNDGSVVFGSYDKHVYKVSAEGKLQWSVETGGKIYCPATIDQDGHVLIGTQEENCLYSIDGSTGKVVWKSCGKHKLGFGAMNSGPAIGDGAASNVIVMNNYDKTIRGFDRLTGKVMWEQPDIGMGGGGATIVNGTAYIGSWNKNLYLQKK